jgi:methyl-accepting chemotaxis protein
MDTAVPSGPSTGGWVGSLGLRTKLLMLVAALGVGAVVLGVVALVKMGQLDDSSHQIYSENLTPSSMLSDIRADAGTIGVSLTGMIVVSTNEQRDQLKATSDAAEADLDAKLASYTSQAGGHNRQKLVEQFTTAWQRFRLVRDGQLVQRARAGQGAQFEAIYLNQAVPAIAAAEQALNDLDAMEVGAGNAAAKNATDRYTSARVITIVVLLAIVVLGAFLALYLSALIVRPLRRVSGVLDSVAAGDLTGKVEVASRDEVGRMADSLSRALRNLRDTIASVAAGAQALDRSSTELTEVNNRIAASAARSSTGAVEVSGLAEEVSTYVKTMAVSADAMAASIREIAQNASEAATVANHAVELADTTTRTIGKLGDSSTQIGSAVKLITAIAEQTNLLALNATIEAARAGDAGKGFAVVAGEVKDLAQETAKATDEISRLVDAIQTDTAGAVRAGGEITEIIGRINGFQTTIASAVEEQTATTSEMSHNVSEAAVSAGRISEKISIAADDARTTNTGVDDAKHAAAELGNLSGQLRDAIGRFTV